jgi:hypothetical protein
MNQPDPVRVPEVVAQLVADGHLAAVQPPPDAVTAPVGEPPWWCPACHAMVPAGASRSGLWAYWESSPGEMLGGGRTWRLACGHGEIRHGQAWTWWDTTTLAQEEALIAYGHREMTRRAARGASSSTRRRARPPRLTAPQPRSYCPQWAWWEADGNPWGWFIRLCQAVRQVGLTLNGGTMYVPDAMLTAWGLPAGWRDWQRIGDLATGDLCHVRIVTQAPQMMTVVVLADPGHLPEGWA